MGGKQKQAQRTKGNARPSSSARAAEALAAGGTLSSGFVGFGSLSGDLGYVPATQGSEEADSSVDADFRMVLRKLSKRDSTTKIKALQEFSTHCNDKEVEAVKTVLTFWPRVYSKLTIDNDRRVREATQQAFEVLVVRVRRNLAPHLRSLMGSWLVAQCDVHAPAATAAKNAFQNAFPPAKQTEAIMYCKEDVMVHIKENLIVHSPQTLCDPKMTEPEDMESKFQKVISSTLLAWRLFMVSVPSDQQQDLKEKYVEILDSPKFWKLAKHQASMIKGSFYAVLSGLCQTNPELANQYADKLCPVVLTNLDDSDPIICPSLWEAVLHTISTIQDCWSKVNPRKAVLPKLWAMMRAGGSGLATTIYPHLLPLLSKVPPEVVGSGIAFYNEFFTNMKIGLSVERVQTSPSEMNAIIHSFIECLKFCLIQKFASNDEVPGLMSHLLEDQLLTLLEASFLEKKNVMSSSSLYSLVVDLIESLQKMSTNSEDSTTAKLAASCYTILLDHIRSVCIKHIESEDGSNSYVLNYITMFLSSFKCPSAATVKKKSRVKFVMEETTETEADLTNVSDMKDTEISSLLLPDGPVLSLVRTTCQISFVQFKTNGSVGHLTFITKLVKVFKDLELLAILDPEYTIGEKLSLHENSTGYLDRVVLPWLDVSQEATCNIEIVQDCVVDVTLALMTMGTSSQGMDILSHICQKVDKKVLLHKLFKRTLDEPPNKAVSKWFKGEQFGTKMTEVTRELCQTCLQASGLTQGDDVKASWDLLNLALSTNEELEPVAGNHYVELILKEIQQALPTTPQQSSLSQAEVDRCVCFVCDVASGFYTNVRGCLMLPAAEDLLLALFQLGVQFDSKLTGYVQKKVQSTWESGVKTLVQQKGGFLQENGFFCKAASHIQSRLQEEGHSLDRIYKLCDLALALAGSMKESLHSEVDGAATLGHPSVKALIGKLLTSFNHSEVIEEGHWEIGPLVEGDLVFSSLPGRKLLPLPSQLPKWVASMFFTSKLLVAVKNSESNTVESDITENRDTQDETSLLLDLGFTIGYCRALLGKRIQDVQSSELGQITEQLEEQFQTLTDGLKQEFQMDLVDQAVERSYKDGGLCSLCLGVVLQRAQRWDIMEHILNKLSIMDKVSSLNQQSLQTIMVSVAYLSQAELSMLAEVLTALLISSPQEILTHITGSCGYLILLSKVFSLQEDCLGEPGLGSLGLNADFVLSIMTELQAWRDQQDGLFAFDCVIPSLSWTVVNFNLAVIRYLQTAVARTPSHLSAAHWDLIMCSMVAWIQTCFESSGSLQEHLPSQALTVEVVHLLGQVSRCMTTILPEQRETFPPELGTEWEEFFSEAAYGHVLLLFVKITDCFDLANPSTSTDLLLKSIGSAVALCPAAHVKVNRLPPKLIADLEGILPEQIQTVLNHFCPLLLAHNRATQITAYKVLLNILPELSSHDAFNDKDDEQEKEEVSRQPPAPLIGVLYTCQSGLELMLSDMKVGDTCEVDQYSAEFHVTYAYLLCWKLLLAFFRGAPSELRAEYAQFLRDSNIVGTLLQDLFRLMPEIPVIKLKDGLISQSPMQKLSSTRSMLGEEPVLDISGECGPSELQHLACAVYYRALRDIPAIIRQWWASQDKRTAGIVDKFTSNFVSPVLCSEELTSVHDKEINLENMTVKTRQSTREVIATYSVQEFAMELVVTLPVNHPLGVIAVESGKRIRVANTQWRNWMLQLITFLTHQNGSLMEGLFLWKRNVDKRFEGVEECMICFSVLHNTNYQLPKLQCKICKKKFHSACLYKWFSTSNKSTCPLCRSLF